jgi:hypothetical protein
MSRHWSNFVVRLLCVLSAGSISALHGQALVDVTVQFKNAPIHSTKATGRANDPAPAAIWLTPLASGIAATPSKTGNYTLLQKNKQFSPHVLVVPVGAVVHFPNADPFPGSMDADSTLASMKPDQPGTSRLTVRASPTSFAIFIRR